MKNSINVQDIDIDFDQENKEPNQNYPNLDEPLNIDKTNSNALEKNKKNNKSDNDIESEYDLIFRSTLNVQNMLKKSSLDMDESLIESSNLDIDKELLHKSKLCFNNTPQSDFLKIRNWDYKNDDKILQIEEKLNKIINNLNKGQVAALQNSIKNCKFDVLYNNFNPRKYSFTIGTLSSLDFLIESTYYSDFFRKDLMFEDKKILEKYIYKFRSIMGDGDCFYRSLIFEFLENAILTNNIMLMKEILVLFYEKISMDNKEIQEKEYLKEELKKFKIDIVVQILYVILMAMDKNISFDPYELLLKVFLFCSPFDYGMIFFTRYLLYEYIKENENKIYSEEYQIKIGCLLPDLFISENKDKEDEYFFENYYGLQLMKMKTFAEKIVIYISPFVFNCNISVLIYDFGTKLAKSVINEKLFKCGDENSLTLKILFRKAHYDIIYDENYYNEFKKKLDILPNINESICILNKKIETNNYNNNLQNDFYQDFQENNNDEPHLPKCLECKNTYENKENAFGLCINCLESQLKSTILGAFLNYLQTCQNYNVVDGFKNFIRMQICSISFQKNIPLLTAIQSAGYNYEDLLCDVKKGMCLYCGFGENEIKNKYFFKLPCECRFCQKSCFQGFLNLHKKQSFNLLEKNNPTFVYYPLEYCACGHKNEIKDFLEIIKSCEDINENEAAENFKNIIKNKWKWMCMICKNSFDSNKTNLRIFFKDPEIKLKMDNKDFKHLLCEDCNKTIKIKEKQNIDCNICHSNHLCEKICKVDAENKTESNCLIF